MKKHKKGFGRITQWICEYADRILSLDIIFLVGCIVLSIIFGGRPYERFDDIILWSTAALSGIAMGLTGLLIFKQFSAQKEINHYTMMPKMSYNKTDDYHNICTRDKSINIHFSHMFKNESVNSGYAKIGVYAFVSNSNRSSSNPVYYCYKLRPHRCHFFFGFENEIEIYSGTNISSSYQLPYAFKRMNDEAITYNKDDKKNDISCDYEIIKQTLKYISGCQINTGNEKPLIKSYNTTNHHIYYELDEHCFRMYFCFLCAIRSKQNSKDIYDYLIKDIRNVSFSKPEKNKKNDEEYLKRNFKLQKPYRLPKFLDDLLPSLNEDGMLKTEAKKYKVVTKFDKG